MIRRPPRSTRTDTLFPYTTLFRSLFALLIFAVAEPARRNIETVAVENVRGRSFMRFLRSRRSFFVPHFIGFSCVATTRYALLAWPPAHLSRNFGMAVVTIGTVMVATNARCGIVGGLANGALVDSLFAGGRPGAHLCGWPWVGLAFGI